LRAILVLPALIAREEMKRRAAHEEMIFFGCANPAGRVRLPAAGMKIRTAPHA
jgi:hypothetical protein